MDKYGLYVGYLQLLIKIFALKLGVIILLSKLKNIRNFNILVILLSKDNKYEYNEEYLKVGFTDILIKPLKKDSILDIIDKYIEKDEI